MGCARARLLEMRTGNLFLLCSLTPDADAEAAWRKKLPASNTEETRDRAWRGVVGDWDKEPGAGAGGETTHLTGTGG